MAAQPVVCLEVLRPDFSPYRNDRVEVKSKERPSSLVCKLVTMFGVWCEAAEETCELLL